MKNMFVKLSIMAAILVIAARAQATTYTLDASHTTIGFAIRHMVVANVKGQFNTFSGTINYDAAAPENTTANAIIQVNSIDTANADRDAHLLQDDFFAAEKFPEITFETTSVQGTAPNLTLIGNLTMKGVTREIRLPVELNGPITDPWGKERIGISGTAEINRQDFGISFSKTLDNGGLVVGDIVKLIIEAEGIKQ